MRAALYARVSTHDQQTLGLQTEAMTSYIKDRGWNAVKRVEDRELTDLGVGFVSLTEALDLTTPTGRAMTGMVAVFAEFEREILRERVRAGIAQARKEGRPHGRPRTASLKADEIWRLKAERASHSEIARRLGIGRTSVRRILADGR